MVSHSTVFMFVRAIDTVCLSRLKSREQTQSLLDYRRNNKFNSKLFLPSISKEFMDQLQAYNTVVKDVYSGYIDSVARAMRSFSDGEEQILPFSNTSFIQNCDYDQGTFEYRLHHHHSQQAHNPSISPFAGPSGLTHQQFMSNYNSVLGSWDLAYDLDLSPEIVPYVDVESCDHTGTTYHLNSYGLDFFQFGSERLLMTENGLSAGDTYQLLLDLHLILSSVKTSLEIIVNHEQEQNTANDLQMFLPLYDSMANVQSIFAKNFVRAYPRRQKI
jgi:hypothetical protein